MELFKLNIIIIYSLLAFFVSFTFYPLYILFLKRLKAGQQIREDDVSGKKAVIFQKMHAHKQGTPSMGGGMFLIVIAILVLLSIVLQKLGYINNSLFSRNETYILLFAFFSMGGLGLLDDYLNARGVGKMKGITAKMKLLWMFLFSGFIAYWFYYKLGVTTVNFWPIGGEIDLGFWYVVLSFFFTVGIVNALNITDGLDGLAGGLSLMMLLVLGMITYFYGWYLSTTLVCALIGVLTAFLWFNINPAKIFMGDSGALALGGFISALVYLLNIRLGIIVPFMILFAIMWLELSTSFLQIFWKKYFKRKLFPIAPLHHMLEYRGDKEYTIVMKFWLVQGILAGIAMLLIFYQFNIS